MGSYMTCQIIKDQTYSHVHNDEPFYVKLGSCLDDRYCKY